MKIYSPIRFSHISQNFGENRACQYPNKKIVDKRGHSCPGDSVDFYKSIGMKGHNGTDRACPHRAVDYFNVEADTKWEARYDADFAGGLGLDIFSKSPISLKNFSRIQGVDEDAIKYYTDKGWYNKETDECLAYVKRRGWHYDEYLVQNGEEVYLGKAIALCGTTGTSSNDHLHEGFKIVDENRKTLGKNNGFYGAINVSNLNDPHFVIDVLKKKGSTVTELPMTLSDHLYKIAYMFGGTDIEKIFESVGKKFQ